MSLFENIKKSILVSDINLVKKYIDSPEITVKNIKDAINIIYSMSPGSTHTMMQEHINTDPRDNYLKTEEGKQILELLENKLKSISYKEKYLKYKLKYLNLQNKLI